MSSKKDVLEISQVPEVVDSQEELDSEYDSLVAYHGTTHRFRSSILEHGLDPENPVVVEGGKSDRPLVFFGSEKEEDMEPQYSEGHDAETYGIAARDQIIGGKAMVIRCELPIDNLERDDVAHVDGRGDTQNLYQSITNYGVAAHHGRVEPEQIIEIFETHDSPTPPKTNELYVSTDEFSEWMDAYIEQDIETLQRIGSDYESQIAPREYIEEGEKVRPGELYRKVCE